MTLPLFQTYLSVAKDIFTILASIIAGVVAIIGLQTWRKQLIGKNEYELAQKLLKAVYRVRGAVFHVRNPYMSAGEIGQAMKEENIEGDITNPSVHAKYETAVYQRRWIHIQDSFSELEMTMLEAEAIWGNKISVNFRKLKEIVGELYANVQIHIRQIQDHENYRYKPELIEKADSIIYGFNDTGNDEFTRKLLASISEFDEFLKPKLKS